MGSRSAPRAAVERPRFVLSLGSGPRVDIAWAALCRSDKDIHGRSDPAQSMDGSQLAPGHSTASVALGADKLALPHLAFGPLTIPVPHEVANRCHLLEARQMVPIHFGPNRTAICTRRAQDDLLHPPSGHLSLLTRPLLSLVISAVCARLAVATPRTYGGVAVRTISALGVGLPPLSSTATSTPTLRWTELVLMQSPTANPPALLEAAGPHARYAADRPRKLWSHVWYIDLQKTAPAERGSGLCLQP